VGPDYSRAHVFPSPSVVGQSALRLTHRPRTRAAVRQRSPSGSSISHPHLTPNSAAVTRWYGHHVQPDTDGDDPQLGGALSGGGAFGASHVGVLQVLEERGLRPGIVTGTSSGALVGSAYAAGLGGAAIERIARRFRWNRIARWTLRPRWGLLDTTIVTDAVRGLLGEDPRIEDLPRRFGAVATD